MIGFAKIAAGAPSTTDALTKHLMNNTLKPEQAVLAAYYGHGLANAGGDQLMRGTAEAVAEADISFEEGLNLLMERWERRNPFPGQEAWQAWAETQVWDATAKRWTSDAPDPIEAWDIARSEAEIPLMDRLDVLVERAAAGLLDAPLAVVRPDVDPRVLEGLGIEADGILTAGEINALLAGRRADGEMIDGKKYAKEQRLPVDPKTGEVRHSTPIGSYDFCPTPDKSISVAWAFAPEAERAMIYQAHIDAAREAVAYIGTQIGQARKGDKDREWEPGHIGWLEFTHHTARRTQFTIANGEVKIEQDGTAGDPDLHTHFLIPNAVFCDSGRVGSLDTAAVGGFLFEADAFYHLRLTTYLREAGFATHLDPKTGAVRMSDVPEDMRVLFSKRTQIGEVIAQAEAKNRGEKWEDLTTEQREARVKNAVQSHDQKVKGGKDDVANFEDWRRQAREFGKWEPTTFLGQELKNAPEPHRHAYSVALPILDERLQQRAVLPHFDARVAAARGLIDAGGGALSDMDAVTRIMRQEGVTQYGDSTALVWGNRTGQRYMSLTTALHESDEHRFIDLARRAAADRSHALTPREVEHGVRTAMRKDPKLQFDGDHGKAQRAAIERLGTGGKFGVVVAAAGAGKTTSLKPLVEAWNVQKRDVWGASLAWRQADDLTDAGIPKERVRAFAILIENLKAGSIRLNARSVVAIDELGLLGTRQGLELLQLREKHGFSIVALGDDKQAQSIEAGSIIDLTRRALGAEQVPQIITTIRQQSDQEKLVVGLFRDGEAAAALTIKRAEGTAEMVPGGYNEVIKRVAELYRERLEATGEAPTISAPTNADAHRLSEAVRAVRRGANRVEALRTIRATDGQRNYAMDLVAGDKVRLFKAVGSGAGGSIGRNGSVLEVIGADDDGLTLKAKTGRIGTVPWEKLDHKGRTLLAYGDAMTIHTAQGSTANEHIFALPSGAQAVNGKLGYSASTRHRLRAYILTSETAERNAVRERRPLNDTKTITTDDKWAQVARALSQQPIKENAVQMIEQVNRVRRGAVLALAKATAPRPPRPPGYGGIGQAVAALKLNAGRKVSQSIERLRQYAGKPTPPQPVAPRVRI